MAIKLRELQESSVGEEIFQSVIENENGKSIEFERPISDIAFQSFTTIMSLTAALEMKNSELGEAFLAAEERIRKQNRHVCELFDDNNRLRQRIAELEARLFNPAVRRYSGTPAAESRWAFVSKFMEMRNVMLDRYEPYYCIHVDTTALAQAVDGSYSNVTLEEAINKAIARGK